MLAIRETSVKIARQKLTEIKKENKPFCPMFEHRQTFTHVQTLIQETFIFSPFQESVKTRAPQNEDKQIYKYIYLKGSAI